LIQFFQRNLRLKSDDKQEANILHEIRLNSQTVLTLSMIVYFIAMCLPIAAANGSVFNMLIFACIILFVLSILHHRVVTVYFLGLLISITILNYLIYKTQWTDYTSLSNKMLMLYEFWLPVLMCVRIFSHREINEKINKKALINIFLVLYTVSCATTIAGNLKYNIPSRYLATSVIEESMVYRYRMENIGGFGFCYLTLFLVPLLLYALKRKQSKLYLIPLILSYLCAIESEYVILIGLLGIVTVWTLLDKLSDEKKFLILVIELISLVVIVMNLDGIFQFLLNITNDHESIYRRINEIYTMYQMGGVDATSDVFLRGEVYGRSWELFLDNPLMGSLGASKVGGHSEILDLLGSAGLLAYVFVFSIIWCIRKDLFISLSNLSEFGKSYIKVNVVMLVLLALLNPFFSARELGMLLLLLFLFVTYFDKMENMEENLKRINV